MTLMVMNVNPKIEKASLNRPVSKFKEKFEK